MMKRLLLVFVLLLPMAAFGQSSDREVLLTTDGTLYTAESMFATAADTDIHSNRYLMLTVQRGNESKRMVVPATATGGSHLEPSLAYDNETKTLFIFWEAARGGALTTDLAFVWYRDGAWGKLTTLDAVDWDLRANLRIALTLKTDDTAKDGTNISIPELTVHAVWWEEGPASEWARYAMITLDRGDVSSVTVTNLDALVGHVSAAAEKPSNNEILRHPAIFPSANHDSVDVVFGDVQADKMHRITIRPVAQGGRLRVPVGKDHEMPSPTAAINAVGNVGAISTRTDNVAYYFASNDSVKYLLYKDGKWSDGRSIPLGEHLTADGAVNAMRRMLNSE